jgi:hypothetical protein
MGEAQIKKASSDVRKRQWSNSQRIFLIFPRVETREAGISTWHSAGLSRTGCYGFIGPDPSAVLDKYKRFQGNY